MNLRQAEQIYKHPKGYPREVLTECLQVLNLQPHRLTIAEQIVIADASERLSILKRADPNIIEGECHIVETGRGRMNQSPRKRTMVQSLGLLKGGN